MNSDVTNSLFHLLFNFWVPGTQTFPRKGGRDHFFAKIGNCFKNKRNQLMQNLPLQKSSREKLCTLMYLKHYKCILMLLCTILFQSFAEMIWYV